MTPAEKVLTRWLFQVKVARLHGFGFQNFFSHLMSLGRPGFSPVKPQGAEGDWKNDGHEPLLGRYYQVYAPEVLDEAQAIKKLKDDFAGLWAKWSEKAVYPSGVKEFYFVLNDAYRVTPGVYPSTYATLEDIRQTYALNVSKPFLTKDLEDFVLDLDDDKVWSVVGLPPNPADIKTISLSLISEVTTHIVENPIPRLLAQSLSAPDFYKKIAINNLTIAGDWLRAADYRRGTVEQYFTAQSNFLRQEVRDKLQSIYEVSGAQGFADISGGATASDQRFGYILNEVAPLQPSMDSRLRKEIEDASIVTMAYFFEACDIFEEPK